MTGTMTDRKAVSSAWGEKHDAWPSLRLYDTLGIPYVLGPLRWKGPLWTGHCMMLDTTDLYADAGFFHELSHWLVASQRQRGLPDLGLGRQINSQIALYASSATGHVYRADRDGQERGWGERCISERKAQDQENLACWALALYEPLCGIWGWDGELGDDALNKALDDFSGSDGVQLGGTIPRRLYRRIVRPLIDAGCVPDVEYTVVADYLARVEDVSWRGPVQEAC